MTRARRITVCAAIGMLSAMGAGQTHAQPGAQAPLTLECENIRRLSDNYLLDLRIRMDFDTRRHRYARFENAGRGWQFVGDRPYGGSTPGRIVLDETPFSTAYVERLTGDYYYIDRSGVTLSVWGRCATVGPLERLF